MVRVGRRQGSHHVGEAGGLDRHRVRRAVLLFGGCLPVVLPGDQRVDAEDEQGSGHDHHDEDPAGRRTAYGVDDADSGHRPAAAEKRP
jgi:hypothetical protein